MEKSHFTVKLERLRDPNGIVAPSARYVLWSWIPGKRLRRVWEGLWFQAWNHPSGIQCRLRAVEVFRRAAMVERLSLKYSVPDFALHDLAEENRLSWPGQEPALEDPDYLALDSGFNLSTDPHDPVLNPLDAPEDYV